MKTSLIQVAIRGTIGTVIGVIASFFVALLIWGLMNLAAELAMIRGAREMLFPILIACMSLGSLVGLSVGVQDAREHGK